MSRQAKFYDISVILNPEYERTGYITSEMAQNLAARVNAYVLNQEFLLGDILFVGDTYETRQEYGFYMVTAKGIAVSSEAIVYLPVSNKDLLSRLQSENVKYNTLLQQMTGDYMFFPDDEDEKTDIINTYMINKLK